MADPEPHHKRKGIDRPDAIYLNNGSFSQLFRIPGTTEEEWEQWKRFLSGHGELTMKVMDYLMNQHSLRNFAYVQRLADLESDSAEGVARVIRQRVRSVGHADTKRFFRDLWHSDDNIMMALDVLRDSGKLEQIGEHLGSVQNQHMDVVEHLKDRRISMKDLLQVGDIQMIVDELGKDKHWFEKPDSEGFQPLAHAVAADRRRIVQALVKLKADPRCVDSEGNSCLHYAAGYGHKELTNYFMEFMVDDLNLMNDEGQTPCAVAIANHHQDIANMLEKHGGNLL